MAVSHDGPKTLTDSDNVLILIDSLTNFSTFALLRALNWYRMVGRRYSCWRRLSNILQLFTFLLDYVLCIGVAWQIGGTLADDNNALIYHLTIFHTFARLCYPWRCRTVDGRHLLTTIMYSSILTVLLIFSLLLNYPLHGSVILWAGDTLAHGDSLLILIDSRTNFYFARFCALYRCRTAGRSRRSCSWW